MQNPKLKKKVLKSGAVTYSCYYRDSQGKQRHFSYTGNKSDSQFKLNQLLTNVQEEKLGVKQSLIKGLFLSELKRGYLKYSSAFKAKGTCNKIKWALDSLLRFKGDVPVLNVTNGFCDNFIAFRLGEVKAPTVASDLNAIRACFTYAVNQNIIRSNPWFGKKVKLTHEVPAYFSKDQVAILLNELKDNDLEYLVKFMLFSDCRRNEALTLEWSNVNKDTVVIKGKNSKTRRTRVIHRSQLPQVFEVIEAIPEDARVGTYVFCQQGLRSENKRGKMYDPHTVTERVKRIYRRLGFEERYNVHSLRKTWCSWLLIQGTPIHLICALGGWASVSTVEKHYSSVLEAYPQMKVPALPYG